MSGKISATSEYKKGSVFTARVMQKHVDDEVIGAEVIHNLKTLTYSEHKRGKFGAITRISLPYARVLIVDDVVTNLDVARGLMKPYGMQIDCVTSGWEAVEAMHDESVRYNAVFMDHMMPGMDGLEATKLIREIGTDYAKNVPIIALTANAIAGNEEMFLSKGFQAFISKPIEIIRLDNVIREWVRDKEQEKLYGGQDSFEAASATQNNENQVMINKAIEGLSIEKGVKRFGGDAGTYLDVLRSYAKNTMPLLEAIKAQANAPPQSLVADYETIVHGIKGSSRGVCADDVADIAEALEKASHNLDYDYVSANNGLLIKAATKLIADIETLLEEARAAQNKPRKPSPDKEMLARLKVACDDYDINVIDTVMEELEAFEYDEGGELVEWLRQNAELSNFGEIVERLDDIN